MKPKWLVSTSDPQAQADLRTVRILQAPGQRSAGVVKLGSESFCPDCAVRTEHSAPPDPCELDAPGEVPTAKGELFTRLTKLLQPVLAHHLQQPVAALRPRP